jgi:enoyl-CoA hydratase
VTYQGYKALSIDIQEGIARVTMQFKGEDIETRTLQHTELFGLWRVLERDSAVRAVLITGVDDEFYLSGAPPATPPSMSLEETRKWALPELVNGEVAGMVHEMTRFGKPVVAAIKGPAAGTGLTVAMLSDISVMAEDAWLCDPHVLRGMSAGDGPGGIWPLYTGLAKAKLYLLTSDAISGVEAERIGLVSRVAPSDRVMEIANDYAARLAAAPEIALRFTKRSINQWLRLAEVFAQDYAVALEGLSFFSGERDARPLLEWPPRQVP